MRKIIITVVLLSVFSSTRSQSVKGLIDTLSNSVVFLYGQYITQTPDNHDLYFKDTDGKIKPLYSTVSGTGFFVLYNNQSYLITAKHVAEKLLFNSKAVFNDINHSFKVYDLTEMQGKDSVEWTFHPNADVAVLPIYFNTRIVWNNSQIWIPSSAISSKLEAPARYSDVLSYGFPANIQAQRKFAPISIASHVGSGLLDLNNFSNHNLETFFLLDVPSIPGLSGGPVFLTPTLYNDGKFSLAGLMHGVISDQTGGKFAAIVPSEFILETINMIKPLDGNFIIKYPNGKLWSCFKYSNGKFLEILYNYSPEGKNQDKGTLVNGNGLANLYNENGQLVQIITYKDGIFVSKKDIPVVPK